MRRLASQCAPVWVKEPKQQIGENSTEADDLEVAVPRIIELVKDHGSPNAFGLDPIRNIQVLCPMNRGGVGARSLNIELQAALNPAGDRKVERFGWTFAPGDKVMQIENDYDKEVYNGDIGYIDDVDPNAGEVVASFDGRSVTYGFGVLYMPAPAYAATIHKSLKGSGIPAVIIPMLTQHYAMLQRNLLYTGVTRGKRLVVLVGRRRPSPSRSETSRGGGVGRGSASGCVPVHPSHSSWAWRAEPWWQPTFCRIRRCGSGSMGSSRPGRCSLSTVCGHCGRSRQPGRDPDRQ